MVTYFKLLKRFHKYLVSSVSAVSSPFKMAVCLKFVCLLFVRSSPSPRVPGGLRGKVQHWISGKTDGPSLPPPPPPTLPPEEISKWQIKSWKLQKLLSSSTLAANISVQHLQTLSALFFACWCRPLCLLIISPVSTPPLKQCPWPQTITVGYMDPVHISYWNRQFMILAIFSMKWSYLQVIAG